MDVARKLNRVKGRSLTKTGPRQFPPPFVREIGAVLRNDLPSLGAAGSRSAQLHRGVISAFKPLSVREQQRFAFLRWTGTLGSLLIGFGALGAGALPVIDNPYIYYPGGNAMARMLQTSSVVTFVGVAFLVLSWVLMAPFVAVSLSQPRGGRPRASVSMLRRTFVAWTVPLALTAPIFTQDIYSYLAQGSIVARGLDPYAGGPIDVLGSAHPLSRSVPLIWAHSPSPYGPVALGIAAAISRLTADSIFWGVTAHRVVAVAGVAASAWTVVKLARRCGVTIEAALWLGALNPLVLLHLIGGIHNEAVLLGLLLVGCEISLRGVDAAKVSARDSGFRAQWHWLWRIIAGAALISMAGMVKVTGFVALGFVGMALAGALLDDPPTASRRQQARAVLYSAAIHAAVLAGSIAAVSAVTGIGLGWITGQGGAATIRSWMSISTDTALVFAWIGMHLGLGDHSAAMLVVTRLVGLAIGGVFTLRMLWATLRGSIHPIGGLGMSMLILVILFPVVHPWYLLWAIVPLAAWANRPIFRVFATTYCALMSFFVLPRGLTLPAFTVLWIYGAALISFVLIALIFWRINRVGATGGLATRMMLREWRTRGQ